MERTHTSPDSVKQRRILYCAIAMTAAVLGGCLSVDSERCYRSTDVDLPDEPGYLLYDAATGQCNRVAAVDAGMDAMPDAEPMCRTNGACPAPDASLCSDEGLCGPCGVAGDCTHIQRATACLDGTCVQCIDNAACTDVSASKCTDTRCEACETDVDCAHLKETGTGACVAGTCQACSATNTDACDEGKVCNVPTSACTDIPENRTPSCRDCVSSAQCAQGVCAALMDEEKLLSYYCLPESEPGDGCANQAPLSSTVTGFAIEDQKEMMVCVPTLTTCEALRDTRARKCSNPEPDSPEGCGREENQTDGYCVLEEGTQYACTTPCDSSDDCRNGADCVAPAGRTNLSGLLTVCDI